MLPNTRHLMSLLLMLSALLVLGAFPSAAQPLFIAPVDSPLYPTGSFAELRPGHFHAGIDFGTGGQSGKAVCASAAGWVSRIKSGPSGYGRVVYVDHPEGFTTVYGHLHAFRGDLSEYVDSARLAQKSPEAELYPDSGRFLFDQGEFIGWSGNSGSSQGPHLHFEIRDRNTQEPLDPGNFTRFFVDSLSPLMPCLAVYNKGKGYFKLEQIGCSGDDTTVVLEVSEDTVYLGVLAWDPATSGRNGIAEVRLYQDDSLIFHYRPRRFSFNETRFANAHADLLDYEGKPRRFHRLFVLPGDTCTIYRNSGSGGLVTRPGGNAGVRMETTDASGNRTQRLISLMRKGMDMKSTSQTETDAIIEYHRPWSHRWPGGMEVSIPNGALYQHAFVDSSMLTESLPEAGTFFSVLPALEVPLHKAGRLYIPAPVVNLQNWKKQLLMIYDNPRSKTPEVILADTISGERLVFPFRRGGGWFKLEIDTLPPEAVSRGEGCDIVDGSRLMNMVFNDGQSGLKNVDVFVNGEWIVSDLDLKTGTVEWKQRWNFKGPSIVMARVVDRCGNTAEHVWAY